MVTRTALKPAPVESMTLPRTIAARLRSIVPGATPVCTGFGPVYRNPVDSAMVVATEGSTGGAIVAGSGGRPVGRVVVVVGTVVVEAVVVETVVGGREVVGVVVVATGMVT